MIPPFFGLSVVIHLLIIAGHKLRSLVSPRVRTRHIIGKSFVASVFGALSVFCVFAFVMFCAVTILYASFVEPHSDIKFVQHTVPKIVQFDYNSAYAEVISIFPQLHTLRIFGSSQFLDVLLLFFTGFLCAFFIVQSHIFNTPLTFMQRQTPALLRIFVLSVGVGVLLVGTTSAMLQVAQLFHIPLAHPPTFVALFSGK